MVGNRPMTREEFERLRAMNGHLARAGTPGAIPLGPGIGPGLPLLVDPSTVAALGGILPFDPSALPRPGPANGLPGGGLEALLPGPMAGGQMRRPGQQQQQQSQQQVDASGWRRAMARRCQWQGNDSNAQAATRAASRVQGAGSGRRRKCRFRVCVRWAAGRKARSPRPTATRCMSGSGTLTPAVSRRRRRDLISSSSSPRARGRHRSSRPRRSWPSGRLTWCALQFHPDTVAEHQLRRGRSQVIPGILCP